MLNFLRVKFMDRSVRKGLHRLERSLASKMIANALVTAMEGTVLKEARKNLRLNDSIFEGNLHKSLRAEVLQVGRVSKIRAGSIGVLYGKNIEEGTPPGRGFVAGEPDKIERWVAKKLKMAQFGPAVVKWVAYRVMEKIQRVGIEPVPFLVPAWNEKRNDFREMFNQKVRTQLGLSKRT